MAVIGYWDFLIENYRQQRIISSQAIVIQSFPLVEHFKVTIKCWTDRQDLLRPEIATKQEHMVFVSNL